MQPSSPVDERPCRPARHMPAAAAVAALLILGLTGDPAQAADVRAGMEIFQHTCGVCHSTEVGVNKVGPSLWNVFGRKVATVPDYTYSEKLRSAASSDWDVWDERHLDAYLSNPRQVLHGVKMFFALPDPNDRANVIAYLRSLK